VVARAPRSYVVLTGHLFAWLGGGQSVEPLTGRFVRTYVQVYVHVCIP
jgi:hypothetical protein